MDFYTDRSRYGVVTGDLGAWGAFGWTYLGPVRIPPTPPTVGMTDRAGTGQVWFLMWDGENHLVLTDELPQYAAGDFYTFQPWDGPYLGGTGWRLGVTTAYPGSGLLPAGTPHLVVDFPGPGAQGWTSGAKPLVAPSLSAPGEQSWPESTGWPSPQPPLVPGIPSSSPLPLGGGFAAVELAFATNSPPLVSSTWVTPSVLVPQPYHLAQWGGGSEA